MECWDVSWLLEHIEVKSKKSKKSMKIPSSIIKLKLFTRANVFLKERIKIPPKNIVISLLWQ